jgi:Asp-tRNA(Asn)/Glu-tRNA(Gln) amidotransferase A subunit family amidase
MTGNDLPALSIADLQSLLRRREVSPREVIDILRERIETVDGDIGAYLSLDIEAALKAAEDADVDLPLGGIPIAIKDIINVMDQPCTCASKILNGYRAPYDAAVRGTCRVCREDPVADRQQPLPQMKPSAPSGPILAVRFGSRLRYAA